MSGRGCTPAIDVYKRQVLAGAALCAADGAHPPGHAAPYADLPLDASQMCIRDRDTRSGSVRDFVAVGDVDIQVIGADAPVLDSEVPVRQILEQVVAKTGIPPFMLGLSWSSTERMSSQQADMLTCLLYTSRCV